MINDSQSWVGQTNFRAWIPPGHPLKSNPDDVTIRVRMRRDFLYRLIKNNFEQLIDSIQVFRPHWHNFSRWTISKPYCAAACAGTCPANRRCTAAIENQCSKHGVTCNWHRNVRKKRKCSCFLPGFWPGSRQEMYFFFVVIHIELQAYDHNAKCLSNESSWLRHDRMPQFSINRPTTSNYQMSM